MSNGTGTSLRCRRCRGRGVIAKYRRDGSAIRWAGDEPCPSCGGNGREPKQAESLRDFRRRVIDPTRNRLQDS